MTDYLPSKHIGGILPRIDSTEFAPDIYDKAGIFVLRRAVPDPLIRTWQAAWARFGGEALAGGRQIDPYNPVVVHESVRPPLSEIYCSPHLLDVLERIYPDLALYMQRFIVKDEQSRAPVFLHQDAGYDAGWLEKTSVFVPLSPVSRDNGGMFFYPGTHLLGYMGDVGELNRTLLDPAWPVVCPTLQPGDIVLMHACAWHGSGPWVNGPDRILAQITYQPASDPTGVELLRGQWRTEHHLANLPRERFFIRSRSSRMRELQAEVTRLKEHKTGA